MPVILNAEYCCTNSAVVIHIYKVWNKDFQVCNLLTIN